MHASGLITENEAKVRKGGQLQSSWIISNRIESVVTNHTTLQHVDVSTTLAHWYFWLKSFGQILIPPVPGRSPV